MSGQRRFLKVWARTVGMPIGVNDEDKPEFLPITQTDVGRVSETYWETHKNSEPKGSSSEVFKGRYTKKPTFLSSVGFGELF